MEKERVDITLDDKLCKVTALFVFSNPTDTAETMEVGFPSSYPAEIKNALVHVDGKLIATRQSMDRKIEKQEFDGGIEEKHIDTHWLLWDMTFEANQTRHVTISYQVEPFDNADYVSTPYTEHRFAIEEEFSAKEWPISPEVRRVLGAIRSKTTGYVLQTGAGWDGPIGEAVITADPITAIRWYTPDAQAHQIGDRLVWALRNIEPDFDIYIEFNSTINLAQERKWAEEARSVHPKSLALKKYVSFISEPPAVTKSQFQDLESSFPHGIETKFVEYKNIVAQGRQSHMRSVFEYKPELLRWLPEDMSKILFDGSSSNGEGVNYKLLNDNQAYIIMKIDGPTLPDGRKAELWEYEYLFYGHLPLSPEHSELMRQAINWSGKQ